LNLFADPHYLEMLFSFDLLFFLPYDPCSQAELLSSACRALVFLKECFWLLCGWSLPAMVTRAISPPCQLNGKVQRSGKA
jgi:hypothetical protein